MAHGQGYILDSVAKCGVRVEGDAGTASPFVIPLDIGCLHPSSYSGEACSTSRRIVTGLSPERMEDHSRPGRKLLMHSVIKRHKKGAKRALFGPSMVPTKLP
jgi:hypothetical protein